MHLRKLELNCLNILRFFGDLLFDTPIICLIMAENTYIRMWVNSTYQHFKPMSQNATIFNIKKKLKKKNSCICNTYIWILIAFGDKEESISHFTSIEDAICDAHRPPMKSGHYTILLKHECSRPVTAEIKYEFYIKDDLEFKNEHSSTESVSESSLSMSNTSLISDIDHDEELNCEA